MVIMLNKNATTELKIEHKKAIQGTSCASEKAQR
jgi:hypothetical protein